MKSMKNDYSKIGSSNGSGQKSRSMDFSSSSSSAAAAVPPQNPKPSPPSRRKEGSSSSASSSTTHHRGSRPEHEDEEPAADIRNKPPQVMPVVVKTPQQQQQQRHETQLDLEWEGAGNGEKFGVILGRRSGSVSSSSACVMKRAFSMRRSSSVSERYCRIHDQQYIMAIASPPLEEAETEADAGGIGTTTTARSQKKLIIIRRGANIFKTCKRLLRL